MVVVTGGGQGIGRAVALAFARGGDVVAVLDRDGALAQECCAEVAASGGTARPYTCDVANTADVDTTFAAIGRVNVLINNAGVGGRGILGGDMATWDRVLAVNLRGAYACCRAAAPRMRAAGGGAIVLISSTRALQSEPDSEPYAASKAGLLGLTHALAASLGPWGIRVNAICPGWIDTATHRSFEQRHAPRHREADRAQHWAGRVGRPEDVAEACRYLCSEAAGFITGQPLVIDGGMTRKMIYV